MSKKCFLRLWNMEEFPPLSTTRDFSKLSGIPESTIRWQIKKARELGLLSAFIRPFGQRKVLISAQEYFRIMQETHSEAVQEDG